MKLKLKGNVAGPWGGGYEGEIVHSPPVPADLAAEMVRRGYAEELPDDKPSPADAKAKEASLPPASEDTPNAPHNA